MCGGGGGGHRVGCPGCKILRGTTFHPPTLSHSSAGGSGGNPSTGWDSISFGSVAAQNSAPFTAHPAWPHLPLVPQQEASYREVGRGMQTCCSSLEEYGASWARKERRVACMEEVGVGSCSGELKDDTKNLFLLFLFQLPVVLGGVIHALPWVGAGNPCYAIGKRCCNWCSASIGPLQRWHNTVQTFTFLNTLCWARW